MYVNKFYVWSSQMVHETKYDEKCKEDWKID
jgi:hypothetical protein